MKPTQVRIPLAIDRAFSVFVEQMETWWPAADRVGEQPFQAIFVEPRVGGRWYERDAQGKEYDWGRVLLWEPPRRVTFSWRSAGEVSIRFTAEGSSATFVELEHTGVDSAPAKPNWVLHVGAIPLKVAPPVVKHKWEEILAEFAKAAR